MYLSQSTAIQIMVGPFVDTTNWGPDDAIDVTDINVDIYQGVSKTTLTITASGGNNDMVSTGSGGMYSLELAATNTATQGHFTLVAYLSGYEVIRQNYFIIDQPSFDSIINGGVAEEVWQTEFSPMVATLNIDSSTDNTLVLDIDPGDYPNDYFTGMIVMVWVINNPYKQTRLVTNYVASTTTLTIDADWDVNPDNTYTSTFWPFQLNESGSVDPIDVNVVEWDGVAVPTPGVPGYPKVDTVYWNSIPAAGAGMPQVDVNQWLDTDVSSDVLGIPDVNIKYINAVTGPVDVIEEVYVTDATTVRNSFADALLKRDWTGMVGEASRSALNALRFLRNRRSIVAGVLSTTKEDDTTIAWSANLITDPNADPITDIDPT